MAAAPPSKSALRAATSASFVPPMTAFAAAAGVAPWCAERRLRVAEPRGQYRLFHLRVDRRGRKEAELQRFELRVAELIIALIIRLRALVGIADQCRSDLTQPRRLNR